MGTARWVHSLTATGSADQGLSTALHEKGDVVIAGSFAGTMQLGSQSTTSNGGNSDIFIAKFGTSCTAPALLPPTAPVQLSATASASQAAIELSWHDQSTIEDGFRIYRSTAGGAWQLIDSVGANATSYADAAVQSNTQYCYRVSAFNHIGNSTYSNTACAQIITTGIGASTVQQQLQIFPNPNNGRFTIRITTEAATEATLVISSITGQQVLQQQHSLQQGENQLQVQLPAMAKGLYLLQVQSAGSVSTRRITVE